MKKNKKLIIIITIVVVLGFVTILLILYINDTKSKKIVGENQNRLQILNLKNEIMMHYNKVVKTNKNAIIYINNKEKYQEIGTISANQIITLSDEKIDEKTKYFKVIGFDNIYYISYQDVEPIELETTNQRYKNYIPFNEEITTINPTIFYDDNDEVIYNIKKELTMQVIIKEDEYYFVEYNNKLLKIKKDNVETINNTNYEYEKEATKIRTIAYHAFYDPNNNLESWCRNSICHPESQIESHSKYLSDNNYFTLTMHELEWFIDGKINLPKNSILITIDDGLLAQRGINILNKYQLNATIFLITSSYNIKDYENTEYIEFHSHGDNLHTQNVCPEGQGGAIKCQDKTTLLNDLKLSREKLNNTTVFCYPFYEYNDYSIQVLKESGFKMAFAGQKGDGYVKRGTDKFQIPRYTITSDVNESEFAQIISN